MSARFPSFETRIVTCHMEPESFVCVALERGVNLKLHKPEVNSYVTQFETDANRQEIRMIRDIDHERAWRTHDQDWTIPAREKWGRIFANIHTPEGRAEFDREQAKLRGRETPFRRDGEAYQHATRIYCDPAPIVSALVANGLSGMVVRLKPYHCFQMVRCICTRHQWRTAQLAWLKKMTSHVASDKRAPVEELSLFV